MSTVYVLGPEGSYSSIIARKVLHNTYTHVFCRNFSEIGERALQDETSLGVLPIENSITSDIHENIDFLFRNNAKIVYESFLKINLNLIGLKEANLEQITYAYSHPRAFAQCTNFINRENIKTLQTASTSEGEHLILERNDPQYSIIAGKHVAENNSRLRILKENIGNDTFNLTRFVFVGNKQLSEKSSRNNKASVIFTVAHVSGALAKLLTVIAKANFNITKIESRPIPGTNWEYHFWIDIEDAQREITKEEISSLFQSQANSHTIVGIYQRGAIFES